jgi:hypothetical protein
MTSPQPIQYGRSKRSEDCGIARVEGYNAKGKNRITWWVGVEESNPEKYNGAVMGDAQPGTFIAHLFL